MKSQLRLSPSTIRSGGIAFLAVVAVVVLAFGATMITPEVSLAATALIMGFGDTPLRIPDTPATNIDQYVNLANNYFVAPTHLCGDSGCDLVAVYTPEDISNFDTSNEVGRANLDNCIQGNACTITRAPYTQTVSEPVGDNNLVVVGASQSSSVATLEKRYLQDNPPPAGTNVKFLLVGNGNRPNGGILERLNGYPGAKQLIESLGFNVDNLTFNGSTPTDTNFPTVDVSAQYDPWTDFPTNPTNQLAIMNAYFGVLFAHGSYLLNAGMAPMRQGQYGDTTYYLYPAKYVPLLQPIALIPVFGNLYADFYDPTLRVQIEAAYDRTGNPGVPTPANPNYAPDPAVFKANLAQAQLVGLDNLSEDLFNSRPYGTTRPGPYGVGGPPVYVGCGTPPCGDPTPIDPTAPGQTSVTVDSAAAPMTSNADVSKKNDAAASKQLGEASPSLSQTNALSARPTSVVPKPEDGGSQKTGSSTVTDKTNPTGTTTQSNSSATSNSSSSAKSSAGS